MQEAYLRAWRGIGKLPRRRAVLDVDVPDHRERRGHARRGKRQPPPDRAARRRRRAGRHPTASRSPQRPAESADALRAHRRGARRAARPSCGRVVVLKDVYGLPHEAIADELGISVPAAKVRLHRARQQAARRCCTRRGGRSPCGVTTSPTLLPGLVDGGRPSRPRGRSATSSRACAARPSWPATASCCAPSQLLRTRYLEPTPGPARRDPGRARATRPSAGAVRSLAHRPPARLRRRASAARVAAGAAAALLIARSRRRSLGCGLAS